MKKTLLLLTLVLSFNLFSQENSEIVDYSIQYEYYLQKGKLDSAKMYIDSLYKVKPNEKKVLMNRGELYFLLNDFDVAENSWLNCVFVDVENEECYEKLIGLYCGIYDLMEQSCADIINKTLKVNQNNQIALFFEAKQFVEKNDIKESIDLFEDLLKIDSNNLRVLNELALLHDTNYKSEFYKNRYCRRVANTERPLKILYF